MTDIYIKLPAWLSDAVKNRSLFADDTARMQFAIDLARQNIDQGTGGPFGAAVFGYKSGELVSAGVNLVTRLNLSMCHAEILALSGAQRRLRMFDLSRHDEHLLLYSSAEPCLMCFGAVLWSGIRGLVYGAKTPDVEAIGFDEGPKPENWIDILKERGIRVNGGLLRESAVQVLQDYAQAGGEIYNPAGKEK